MRAIMLSVVFAGDIGARQSFAETAAAVAAADFDNDRVALLAAVQRMAKSLVEWDAQVVDGQRVDAPRLGRFAARVSAVNSAENSGGRKACRRE